MLGRIYLSTAALLESLTDTSSFAALQNLIGALFGIFWEIVGLQQV